MRGPSLQGVVATRGDQQSTRTPTRSERGSVVTRDVDNFFCRVQNRFIHVTEQVN